MWPWKFTVEQIFEAIWREPGYWVQKDYRIRWWKSKNDRPKAEPFNQNWVKRETTNRKNLRATVQITNWSVARQNTRRSQFRIAWWMVYWKSICQPLLHNQDEVQQRKLMCCCLTVSIWSKSCFFLDRIPNCESVVSLDFIIWEQLFSFSKIIQWSLRQKADSSVIQDTVSKRKK